MTNSNQDFSQTVSNVSSNESGADLMSELDSLFASTRDAQPLLQDDNFTKIVINSLPENNIYAMNAQQQKRVKKRGLSMDLLGGLIGLLVLFVFMDKGALFSSVLNVIPESIAFSPMLIVSSFVCLSVLSVGTWWTIDNNRI